MGFVHNALERHFLTHDSGRHHLGELLPHAEGVPQNPSGIFQSLLGFNGAKGDDLGNPVVAIFFRHITDDLSPSSLIEVHIKVGHRDAIRIQESLKNQAVFERIKLGDAHGVGSHRPRPGTAPRSHTNPVFFCPVNKISNHQEVTGKTHLANDPDLVGSLSFHLVGNTVGVAHSKTPVHFLLKKADFALPLGDGEYRHIVC